MPFKVLNMIIGSGILRSGGKTTYVMVIDLIGTWLFAASLVVFQRRGWMNRLKA